MIKNVSQHYRGFVIRIYCTWSRGIDLRERNSVLGVQVREMSVWAIGFGGMTGYLKWLPSSKDLLTHLFLISTKKWDFARHEKIFKEIIPSIIASSEKKRVRRYSLSLFLFSLRDNSSKYPNYTRLSVWEMISTNSVPEGSEKATKNISCLQLCIFDAEGTLPVYSL